MIVSLVLLAGLVAVVVLAVQRRGGQARQLTGESVRRFFQYLILAGLLFAAGSGLTGLLSHLLDAALDPAERVADESTLALQITFTVIALPLWAALAWWTHRRHRTEPAERQAVLWSAYLTLVLVVSLVVVLEAAQRGAGRLLQWPWQAGPLVPVLVWLAIWWLHRRWASASTSSGQLRLERLVGALISLVAAATSLIMVLAPAVRELLGLTGDSLVATTLPPMLEGAGLLVAAAFFWAVYWLRDLARGPRDTGWFVLVLLVGVGVALVAATAAASTLLWTLLVWLLGDPGASGAREHFLGAPAQLATIVVGLLVWWYHQEVLGTRRAAPRAEVRRVYEYLMSAVGLAAGAAGVVMVLVTLVEALAAGSDLVVAGSAVNALLGALVLLAVGLPLWWWHWRLAQRARAEDPAAEVGSPTRRFYLLVLFGLMGVAAVIALLTLVYLILEDVLAGQVGAETLRSIRFALGVLVTTSLLSAYHWTVFRADRALTPRVATTGPSPGSGHHGRWVLLVGADDPGVADELARRTGSRVQLIARADDVAAPWAVEELVAAVGSAPPGGLVVVAERENVHIVPVVGSI